MFVSNRPNSSDIARMMGTTPLFRGQDDMSTDSQDPDCWHGVQSAAVRKKIQNRLAQRARRKRLAQRRENNNESPSSGECSPASDGATSEAIRTMDLAPSVHRSPLDTMKFATIVPPTTSSSARIFTELRLSVFTALFDNGAMLGLTCSSVVPSKSAQSSPEIPPPLHPTALQRTRLHATWIDRFPFPKMRDNLITLNGIVDEEEFLRDLFSLESFWIKPGRPGWDPAAWVMSQPFSQKWGYLFY